MTHDPKRIEALTAMPYPSTARDLQQFMMSLQWMNRAIPEYNKIVLPLQNLYEMAMKNKRRTKTNAGHVKLAKFGWDQEHVDAYDQLKAAISRRTQLNYPREDMIQCVFTDASEYHSAGMVTQIPKEDANLAYHMQRHEPLGFVGHRFHGSEIGWSTPDKEAFAIWDTLKKLDYLLQMPIPFKLYTDHKNLTMMYNPLKCTKQAGQAWNAGESKFVRSTLVLSTYVVKTTFGLT